MPNYNEIADRLLYDVCDSITGTTPLGFSNGLCGIGWGVEYLVRNKFRFKITLEDNYLFKLFLDNEK